MLASKISQNLNYFRLLLIQHIQHLFTTYALFFFKFYSTKTPFMFIYAIHWFEEYRTAIIIDPVIFFSAQLPHPSKKMKKIHSQLLKLEGQ